MVDARAGYAFARAYSGLRRRVSGVQKYYLPAALTSGKENKKKDGEKCLLVSNEKCNRTALINDSPRAGAGKSEKMLRIEHFEIGKLGKLSRLPQAGRLDDEFEGHRGTGEQGGGGLKGHRIKLRKSVHLGQIRPIIY